MRGRLTRRPRLHPRRGSRIDLAIGNLLYPETHELPARRADCKGGPRPCPYVRCRWHLYLDVDESSGSITFNFPGLEPWELEHSCVLDIAEQTGGMTLDEVGAILNLTRERIRQIEQIASGKLLRLEDLLQIRDLLGALPASESPPISELAGGTVEP